MERKKRSKTLQVKHEVTGMTKGKEAPGAGSVLRFSNENSSLEMSQIYLDQRIFFQNRGEKQKNQGCISIFNPTIFKLQEKKFPLSYCK